MTTEPTAAPTIDEAAIRRLVVTFYGRVRHDPLLAPVFGRAIAPAAWPSHLDRMVDFWSSVLLQSGRYRGQPGALHAAIPGLSPAHFERWLELFTKVANEIFDESQAERVSILANNMGAGLMRVALASRRHGHRDRDRPRVRRPERLTALYQAKPTRTGSWSDDRNGSGR